MFKVSSEIYKETDFQPVKSDDGKVISSFKFRYPADECTIDKDGDLVVSRRREGAIVIEHSVSTDLRLVGLQVWRGALLLADYIFYRRADFCNQNMLELGSGVGLTSIAAAIYVKHVTCTDVDIGGILNLIRRNIERNRRLSNGKLEVCEYDFMKPMNEYSTALCGVIDAASIIFAADVIYDDTLTDAFIEVMDCIFRLAAVRKKHKTIYVALEKRYVFTTSELESVAPMYEYFLKQTMSKSWRIEYLPMDFPQYFHYDRCKELILFKITSRYDEIL